MNETVRLDLHVHSVHSPDGRSTVGEYARAAVRLGLSGFALTDHNSSGGHSGLASVRSLFPQLLVIPGVEVSTAAGHVLLYGVSEAPPSGRTVEETLDWAAGHGGEAVLAHPFRWPHGAGRSLGSTRGFRAVEVLNGHSSAGTNRRGERLAQELGLPATGASDAHHVSELGRAFTTVAAPCGTVDDFLEALRRGRTAPGGRSLSAVGWLAWGFRAGGSRIRRGLRAI